MRNNLVHSVSPSKEINVRISRRIGEYVYELTNPVSSTEMLKYINDILTTIDRFIKEVEDIIQVEKNSIFLGNLLVLASTKIVGYVK